MPENLSSSRESKVGAQRPSESAEPKLIHGIGVTPRLIDTLILVQCLDADGATISPKTFDVMQECTTPKLLGNAAHIPTAARDVAGMTTRSLGLIYSSGTSRNFINMRCPRAT